MDAKTLGDTTLHGWRKHVGNRVAHRAPVTTDVLRAGLVVFWFAASAWYVVQSVRAVRRELARRA